VGDFLILDIFPGILVFVANSSYTLIGKKSPPLCCGGELHLLIKLLIQEQDCISIANQKRF